MDKVWLEPEYSETVAQAEGRKMCPLAPFPGSLTPDQECCGDVVPHCQPILKGSGADAGG